MAKRDKSRLVYGEDDEEDQSPSTFAGGDDDDDDDDDEANEDLSLKILEKALSRRTANQNQNFVGFEDSNEMSMVDLCASSSSGLVHSGELVKEELKGEERAKKKKRKQIELETAEQTEIATKGEQLLEIVEGANTDENAQTVAARETVESMVQSPVEISNNTVLRKLLRGPRYFDPPDSSWETCYNCGEEGHMAVNCPSATKRKKPCFVCGSLEHGAKQCTKALDCFICKRGGHRAKDCPDKHKSGSKTGNTCLRCGESGHDMFLCKNDYSYDDLKDIQCYVCRSFGHLCCVNSVNSSPRKVSCYKCGRLGHTGLACGRQHGEPSGKDSPSSCFRCGETGHFARECPNSSSISSLQGKDSHSVCYKCGEGGHFARECLTSTMIHKRNCDLSTPTLKPHRKSKDHSGYKSAPVELGGKFRRKRSRNEERVFATPQKPRHRGGWIMEDPEDFSPWKTKNKIPRSPLVPSSKNHRVSTLNSAGRFSGSQASKRASARHKYSASRFGNHQNDDVRTNYDRW